MSSRVLSPVSADVFNRRPWVRSGAVSKAIDDAIKAGPSTAIPVLVTEQEDLKRIQHSCHVYSVRKGYRVQTLTDKRKLIVYVRAVRPIQGLYHRAGRPTALASRVLGKLKSAERLKV